MAGSSLAIALYATSAVSLLLLLIGFYQRRDIAVWFTTKQVNLSEAAALSAAQEPTAKGP